MVSIAATVDHVRKPYQPQVVKLSDQGKKDEGIQVGMPVQMMKKAGQEWIPVGMPAHMKKAGEWVQEGIPVNFWVQHMYVMSAQNEKVVEKDDSSPTKPPQPPTFREKALHIAAFVLKIFGGLLVVVSFPLAFVPGVGVIASPAASTAGSMIYFAGHKITDQKGLIPELNFKFLAGGGFTVK